MNRVAVTGLGTINSIGNNINELRESLRTQKIGIDYISQFDTSDQIIKIAAEVKDFDPKKHFERKIAKRYDRFLQFAIVASRQAVEDAGLDGEDWKENAAVTVSSGIGGFKTLHKEYKNLFEKGPQSVRPFLIPMMIADMASGSVALDLGAKGPNFSTMSACASSLHAIILTTMMIKHGYIEVGITGGSEAVIDPLPIAAFGSMTALSPSQTPKTACRPFDKNRNGFIMGEGAGAIILESEEHAKKRGARIYGFIDGFGMTEDAYHISQTDPEGKGAAKAIRQSLKMADCDVENVDLINCHATSTPVGDKSEIIALKSVFGEQLKNISIQSTKSLMGHTLGAAGANELISAIIESENSFVHGMPNLEEPDEVCEGLDLKKETHERDIRVIIKNAFGFGGHNATLLYQKA
ncbi:MAG: 3-oxoacyl-[acyl-carrier-protein] synthase [Thermotogaceae bacterium]|jgi:3-oxoacyl-[acyl-carrier-protein] synthase II|nr:3-oxoacyl-[acyl-carrier-protein] synthase [Thermotogaceae bacterium]